jgi:hypothetical protein
MFSKECLANAFRRSGYLQADLDPLGRLSPFVHPDLDDASGEEADRWRREADRWRRAVIEVRPLLWRTCVEKVMPEDELERVEEEILERLRKCRDEGQKQVKPPTFRKLPEYWGPFPGGRDDRSLEVDTGVPPGSPCPNREADHVRSGGLPPARRSGQGTRGLG